jgi:hypothetical protein
MQKQCKFCGSEFEPAKSFSRYCSKKCKRQNDLARLKETYYSGRVVVEKTCECCKGKFTPRRPNQFYCSIQCRDKQSRARKQGASDTSAWNHKAVRDSRADVSPEISRQAVFASRNDVDRALKRIGLSCVRLA